MDVLGLVPLNFSFMNFVLESSDQLKAKRWMGERLIDSINLFRSSIAKHASGLNAKRMEIPRPLIKEAFSENRFLIIFREKGYRTVSTGRISFDLVSSLVSLT